MSERRFMVAGFPNGDLVVGEVSAKAAEIRTNVGGIELVTALRLREVPLPVAGVAGPRIKVEYPIVEFLPSNAQKIEEMLKPASVNTNLAHWVVELTQEDFDRFLQSINAPTSLYAAPPGARF